MRIALAQINSELGNFKKNSAKIINYTLRAKSLFADIVVFPEASLFGYTPKDMLEFNLFVKDQSKYIKKISAKIPKNILVVFGAFIENSKGKPYKNVAVVLQKGKKIRYVEKTLLPSEDVFDEQRYIQAGILKNNFVYYKRKKILITICEDIWAWANQADTTYTANPLLKLKRHKANTDLVLNLSASPYHINKFSLRLKNVVSTATFFKAPMVYVNTVGAQDELIYDGQSMAVDKKGNLVLRSLAFCEDLNVFDLAKNAGEIRLAENAFEELRKALVLGIKDFCVKNNFSKIHLGLSGGIDSALVACLAVDALGPENVTCFFMPGPYTSKLSSQLSKRLAKNLNVKLNYIDINSDYRFILKKVDKLINEKRFSVVHENLQSRLRALYLNTFSNISNSLLLNTTNKIEFAVGYGTLYGDLCGGLSPIGDLTKSQVRGLCATYNKHLEIIPEKIITRAPTAELKPNQTDEKSLMPYQQLDQLVNELVVRKKIRKSKDSIWLLNRLIKTEFKRWQSGPVLRVSPRAFGKGRRWPISLSYSSGK
jgi:NAD+ synthase (glutamine-hydrolysing)